jgi:hypothetical protein
MERRRETERQRERKRERMEGNSTPGQFENIDLFWWFS